MYRILLVEDDVSLASAVTEYIEKWDYSVKSVTDFQHVDEEFSSFNPHLVLMDIMLPCFSGYHWCSEIRKVSKVPIIFISSASDNMNIVMAVNMGGDDFIAKPFDPMVLTAKLQAMLRRTYEISDSAPFLEINGVQLNIDSECLEFPGGTIELTRNEFRIIRTLIENRGKIVSRSQLMIKLWNDDCYVEENTLTVNMTRLRKKMEQAGLKDIIVTKSGSGYIIY